MNNKAIVVTFILTIFALLIWGFVHRDEPDSIPKPFDSIESKT